MKKRCVIAPENDSAGFIRRGRSIMIYPDIADGEQLLTRVDQRNIATHPRQYIRLLE